MNSHKSSTRIGNAEREEAQRALHEHLNAGRLQVNEYAERTAAAAGATTAAELAVLFTDLPAPRPKLPGSPAGGMLRNPVVLGGLALLALACLGLVVAFAGGSDPVPPPVPPSPTTAQALPTTTTTTPAVRPTPSTAPATASATAGAAPVADGVEVRRDTGDDVITLRPSFGVDLDEKVSPNWLVAGTGTNYGRDIASINGGGMLYFGGDHAVVTGPAEYATCAGETGYANGGIKREDLEVGDTICVRTDQDRYALVTVAAADQEAIQFRAIVWEPAVPV